MKVPYLSCAEFLHLYTSWGRYDCFPLTLCYTPVFFTCCAQYEGLPSSLSVSGFVHLLWSIWGAPTTHVLSFQVYTPSVPFIRGFSPSLSWVYGSVHILDPLWMVSSSPTLNLCSRVYTPAIPIMMSSYHPYTEILGLNRQQSMTSLVCTPAVHQAYT